MSIVTFVSKLLSLFTKCGKPVDFQRPLTYSLYPFPFGMVFPHGCKQENSKRDHSWNPREESRD